MALIRYALAILLALPTPAWAQSSRAVNGQTPSVIGNIPVWKNTVGTLLGDSGIPLTGLVSSVGNYSGDNTLTITGTTGTGPWAGAVTIKCTLASVGQPGCSSPDNVTLTATAGVLAVQYPASGDLMLSAGNGAVPTDYAGTSCTNQVLTGLSAAGVGTCDSITNSYLTAGTFSSITGVGTLTAGTASTGFVVAGVTMTLGSDATGDIYYRNSLGVLTRLGIGSTGNVLTVSGGLPAWGSGSFVDSLDNYAADSTLTITGTGSGPWTGAVTIKCTVATSSQIGCSEPDNTTIKATAGSLAVQYPTSGDLMLSAGSGAEPTAYGGVSCTNQFLTGLSAAGAASSCTSVTNAYLTAGTFTSITGVGALAAGSLTTGFTAVAVAQGGTNCSTASGTCLDNITGFSSTGFLTRTGSGTYAFQSTTNGITLANIAQLGASSLLGNPTGSTANMEAITLGSTLGFSSTTLNCTTATSSQLGCVSPDGTIITVSTGAITVAKASNAAFGVMEGDGTTITCGAVTPGVCTAIGAVAASIAKGTTTVTSADGSNYILTTGTVSAGTGTLNDTGPAIVYGGSFGLSGNISAAAWTTSGIRYKNVSATLTDTSSSGTVATAYTDVFGGNTIAASSATTYTNYYASYFVAPTAGTNVTFTHKYALGADSLNVTTLAIGGTAILAQATTGALGAVEIGAGLSVSSGVASAGPVPTQGISGTGNTFTGAEGIAICSTTCTITPPVPAAGYEFCVLNGDNVSTVITLGAIGSSAFYEKTARNGYGTAGTGTLTSGGAVADMICIVGLDSTHYLSTTYVGTWTAS